MIKYLMLMSHEKEVMSNVYAKYSTHKNVRDCERIWDFNKKKSSQV